MRNLCRFSKKYVNFSSLLRMDGSSIVDPDVSFIYYAGGKKRILWAVHNVVELAAFCAAEIISATSVLVYCYKKYDNERFGNVNLSAHCVHPLPFENVLVGNVLIEVNPSRGMAATNVRPDLKIVINDIVAFDSPWKSGA